MSYGMSLVSIDPHLLTLPPLSLYIHIPWCVRKCPYCDFNSHAAATIPEQEYIRCLTADLEEDLPLVQGRQLQSIFFGGGTPSLFSGQAIGEILGHVEKHIPFSPDIEITLEANPGTVEQNKFHDFKAAGINRLSIGVQSFQQRHLQKLGRIHSANEAIKAAESAIKAGLDNFNLDLMHGLPEQSPQQALADLQQAIDLNPQHLSWYQLTIETNTEFYSNPPPLPADETLADIQDAGEQLLAQHGFGQYEVSAYSQAGKQCRHNLNYWQFGDYLGIGAGAHGKITDLQNRQVIRNQKTRNPKDYMDPDKKTCSSKRVLSAEDISFEFMMFGLRLNQGINKKLFSERTGQSFSTIKASVDQLCAQKLLSEQPQTITTTELGRRYLNEVVEKFL
jgi:oxygen-independent coproporphyrinogen-3 oxidase